MKASEIDIHEAYAGVQQHAGHRAPFKAGGADRYYGRRYNPNFTYHGLTFVDDELTPEQRLQYQDGWEKETDRKDWGNEPRGAIDDLD